jgi:hypothetical protein
MKASDYQEIGHYLRDIRDGQKVSIADAAEALHIRPHYLLAIEAGDFSVLPGKAYVRGYIKNYALFLGINPEEALSAYDAVSGVVIQDLFIPEPTVKENLPSSQLLIVAIGGILLLVLVYLFISKREHVELATVEDVPGEMMLSIESKKNTRAAQWNDCLRGGTSDCFILLYQKSTIVKLEAERRAFLKQNSSQ